MRTKTKMIRIEEQLYTRLAKAAGSTSLTRFVNELLDEALATRKNVELDKRAAEWAEAERELYGVPSYEATTQSHGVPETSLGSQGHSPNTPTPNIPETPKAAGQQRVAEQQIPADTPQQAGLPCCNQASPCKHWRWDPQLAMWQNILTGEIREAQ